MKTIPYTAKDFTWVKISPEQIHTVGEKLIERKKIAYKQLKNILPEKRTFENTVIALEISEGVYGNTMSAIGLLAEVSPSKEIRDTAFKVIMDVCQKLVDIEYDRDIYISLLEYYEGNFSDEKKQLSKEDIKLLEDGIREYKRMGFDLETSKQKKLKTLLKKASQLSTTFGKNINDYSDYILCTEEEIAGVPDRVKASLPRDEKSGKYIVTLQYPHVVPFMSYADDRKKREELGLKNMKKGGKKNLELLTKLVAIRAEIASILGYDHHADFRTENRMAKKAETAAKFQDSLLKKLAPAVKRDVKELEEYAKVLGIKDFQHFDIAYVATKLAKERFNYNPEDVRAYFPVDKVIEEMFNLYQKLFGLTIKKVDYKLWHKDVTLYEVSDAKEKSLIGYFAMDLFPREGKYGHAMCTDTFVGHAKTFGGDEYVAPFSTIVCNFPTPTKKVPSLLSVSETETLFHEFGHCMHMTLSRVLRESQAGSRVAWDFVETPSQFMENWVMNDTMLTKMSKHYITGKILPKELRTKVLSAKKFQSGYAYTRQLIMGKLDLDMHMGIVENPTAYYAKLVKQYTGMIYPEKESLFPAGFGHIGGGYDAGYYSYLWALVYSYDAFSEFEKNGIFNKELGMKWRKEVLEKGSSEDEMKLITHFLGRKPTQEAFLKEVIGN